MNRNTLNQERFLVKLDVKDKKILKELDQNSRQSFSRIGKKVKLPKTVVNYRIKRLVEEGVIKKFCGVINKNKLGYIYCRIFFKFQHLGEFKEKEIIKYISQQKGVYWLGRLNGFFDLGVIILVKTLEELEEFYSDFLYQFDRYIIDKELSIAIRRFYLRNNYFYDEFVNDISQDYPLVLEKLDEIDFKIINLIKENSRLPLIELADRLGLSSQTVQSRLKRLIKKKIISDFRTVVNHNLLGFHHFHVFLNLINMTREREKQLTNYLCSLPQIIHVVKGLGRFDLEFEPMLKSQFELYELMKKLKKRFPRNIQKYDFVLIYQVYPVNMVRYG